MKRTQISLRTFLIDQFYNIGQIRIFWNEFGTKTWLWQYSPDGDVGGIWRWLPWVFPPVEEYDKKTITKGPDDNWCMMLIRTRYASADDAILNPTRLIGSPYAILYAWGGRLGNTGPEEPWFEEIARHDVVVSEELE